MLRAIVSYLLLPYPAILTLLLCGLALLWFTKRQRAGKVLVSVGAGLAILLSMPLTGGWALRPLTRFRPLDDLSRAAGARWVVVLGAGHSTQGGVPPTGRLSPDSLVRVVEGIRLQRALPGSKLVMSGGPVYRSGTQAQVMTDAAVALGVARADIVLEPKALDTAEEAEEVKAIVHDDPFVLVTSTIHMRRSMGLFEKRGMHPVPAPAGFWPNERHRPLPAASQLVTADHADHEYLGLLWATLKGQI